LSVINKYFLEFFLSTFFILTIFASKIPASNGTFRLILSIFPILLTITILSLILKDKYRIRDIISNAEIKSLFLLVFVFIFFHSLGLIYSSNIKYGFQKFYGILFNILPSIIFTFYIVKTWNEIRTKTFFLSLFCLVLLTVLYVIIISPFNYGQVRTISLASWSHVYYGRFVSIVFIVVLFIFLRDANKKIYYRVLALLLLSAMGAFASGLRAAEIGIILFTVVILIYFYIKKRINLNKIVLTSVIILFSFTLILFLSNSKLKSRHVDIVKLSNLKLTEISSLDARYKGIKAGFSMFKDNPIVGVGLGGFNNPKYGEILSEIKYPHNIFLEYLFEFGFIGLIAFLIILYLLIKRLYGFSKTLSIIFLYTLWLALFSHDISSQKEVFIFFSVFVLNKNDINKLTEHL